MTTKANRIFVQRDAKGQITEASLEPQAGFEPCRVVGEREQAELVEMNSDQLSTLASTDLSLVRVLEDLIDLLIDKDLLRFTDLPQVAQQKLLDRRTIRSEMKGLDLLGEETDDLI